MLPRLAEVGLADNVTLGADTRVRRLVPITEVIQGQSRGAAAELSPGSTRHNARKGQVRPQDGRDGHRAIGLLVVL